jgi:hypothetical protein
MKQQSIEQQSMKQRQAKDVAAWDSKDGAVKHRAATLETAEQSISNKTRDSEAWKSKARNSKT